MPKSIRRINIKRDCNLTKSQYELIEKLHLKTEKDTLTLLHEYGFISANKRARLEAKLHKIKYVELSSQQVMPEALTLLPPKFAHRHTVLPLYLDNHEAVVAIDEASDVKQTFRFESIMQRKVRFVYAERGSLLRHIHLHYPLDKGSVTKSINLPEQDVTELLDVVLNTAIEHGASDIHFNPEHDALHLFFRIDGVLQHMAVLALSVINKLSVRVKNLAKLDFTQKRIALDGSFSHRYLEKDFDLRLSTMPTDMGENIVIRILEKDAELFKVDRLGLSQENINKVRSLIYKPHGVILVTGPTGSGKTTTLYAILSEIDRLQKNILTIENPIEYRLPFIKQTQYNPKAGYTYEMAIKSFLRQDPDVILVGEIRDEQTAELAMEASITGHLVLSTLHTNDAISAISRLKSLNVAPYLIGSGMLAVMAQRLIRRLCEECKEQQTLNETHLKQYNIDLGNIQQKIVYRAVGCPHCLFTGYQGRLAIVEVVAFDSEFRSSITDGASDTELYAFAKDRGMKTLREDALAKVLMGVTSFEEIEHHIL